MSYNSPFTTLGAKGGAKEHTLTVAQMPSHRHSVEGRISAGNAPGIAAGTGIVVGVGDWGVQDTGGGQAHPIMNPYIIINYEVVAT